MEMLVEFHGAEDEDALPDACQVCDWLVSCRVFMSGSERQRTSLRLTPGNHPHESWHRHPSPASPTPDTHKPTSPQARKPASPQARKPTSPQARKPASPQARPEVNFGVNQPNI